MLLVVHETRIPLYRQHTDQLHVRSLVLSMDYTESYNTLFVCLFIDYGLRTSCIRTVCLSKCYSYIRIAARSDCMTATFFFKTTL